MRRELASAPKKIQSLLRSSALTWHCDNCRAAAAALRVGQATYGHLMPLGWRRAEIWFAPDIDAANWTVVACEESCAAKISEMIVAVGLLAPQWMCPSDFPGYAGIYAGEYDSL